MALGCSVVAVAVRILREDSMLTKLLHNHPTGALLVIRQASLARAFGTGLSFGVSPLKDAY